MKPRYTRFPSLPNGAPLATNPYLDLLSIIVPEATTNLIYNPSFEKTTTNYAAIGAATIERTTDQQWSGNYGLKVTPANNVSDGVEYTLPELLVIGTTYTFSCRVHAPAGLKLKIGIYSVGTELLVTKFTGTGDWQEVAVTYKAAVAGTIVALRVDSIQTTEVFYTDAWQLETKAYPTTYCDGDQLGFLPTRRDLGYRWTAEPHLSPSTRSAQCRAGGRVMNFRTYGLYILALLGLSFAPIAISQQSYALIGGGHYQRSVAGIREFTVATDLRASSNLQWQLYKKDLINALKPDRVLPQQPFLLRYQGQDQYGQPEGKELEIQAVYAGGLEGSYNNRHGESLDLAFRTYVPFVFGLGVHAEQLDHQDSISDADYILQRDTNGAWSAIGTGMNDTVRAVAFGLDGNIYAGGDFTNAGGTAANRIAKWDVNLEEWQALGSGANGIVYAIAVGPDGSIYIAGAFTSVGGVANTSRIAKWDGSSWSALGTGLNNTAFDLAFDSLGNLYAGGQFTTAGGVAGAGGVAKWDGSSWSVLDTGTSGTVNGVFCDTDNSLYVTGSFGTAGSGPTTVNNIARWNGTAWSALGSGLNLTGNKIVGGSLGGIYVTGSFSTAGGVSASAIAFWNGNAWSALGSGLSSEGIDLAVNPIDASLLAVGGFSTAGGVSLSDGVARWNGSVWLPYDVNTPSSAIVRAATFRDDGALIIGFDTSGSATAAGRTTITYDGTAEAPPTIKFIGPGTVRQVVNATTGQALYFSLTLNDGEEAELVLDPENISFTGNFRRYLLHSILRGSNLTTFRLQPGDNIISAFLDGTTDGDTAIYMQWRDRYHGIDGGQR